MTFLREMVVMVNDELEKLEDLKPKFNPEGNFTTTKNLVKPNFRTTARQSTKNADFIDGVTTESFLTSQDEGSLPSKSSPENVHVFNRIGTASTKQFNHSEESDLMSTSVPDHSIEISKEAGTLTYHEKEPPQNSSDIHYDQEPSDCDSCETLETFEPLIQPLSTQEPSLIKIKDDFPPKTDPSTTISPKSPSKLLTKTSKILKSLVKNLKCLPYKNQCIDIPQNPMEEEQFYNVAKTIFSDWKEKQDNEWTTTIGTE